MQLKVRWKLLVFLVMAQAGSAQVPDLRADLAREFRAQSQNQGIRTAGLLVYRFGAATPLYEDTLGGFSLDQAISVASASKWVTATAIMTLVEQKKLTLDSTTAQVLGADWKGAQGTITLRQLLSFTSGLEQRERCLLRPFMALERCVANLAHAALIAPPGTTFNYGSTHLQVAGRMAEVVRHTSFADFFQETLVRPLGLASGTRYYTMPRRKIGSQPLLAGGLVISTRDYARFLHMIAGKGLFEGKRILAEETVNQMEQDQFTAATQVAHSPLEENAKSYHYALGHWVECQGPVAPCSSPLHSSGGTFGFFPWMDRQHQYLAIYATEEDMKTGQKSFVIAKALRPILEKLVAP